MIVWIPSSWMKIGVDVAAAGEPLNLRDWKIWLLIIFMTVTWVPCWWLIATIIINW